MTRRSSSASSTAGSPAPTRTSRRRSPRTRAPRASAESSTRPRAPGTPRPPTTAPTSQAPSPPPSTEWASPGVAPGVKVASVKVVNDDGYIYPEAAVCGFMWAATHGMQVTNNSYFIDPWEFNCRNDARQRPVWQAVQRAIRYSSNQGVLNIASAGNSNVDLQHKFIDSGSPNDGSYPVEDRTITGACVDLPAEAPGVVTVSAVGTQQLKTLLQLLRPGRRRRHGPRRRQPPAQPGGLDRGEHDPVHGHQHHDEGQRLGLQAGHLDGQPARRGCRGARAVGPPEPLARRPRVDARADRRRPAVPRGCLRPAPEPAGRT